MKLLLKIAFDGTDFCGYQAQPDRRTVQGVLTEKFSELIGEPMTVTGCSRTDSGVHAEGFVVAVEPEARRDGWLTIPYEKFHRAANNLLPCDISVLGAFITEDDSFHPRYSVVKKEYVYRIDDGIVPSPFRAGRVFFYGRELSDGAIKLMNEASSRFVGRHDFTSFMASGSKITDAVREVFAAGVERRGDIVEFSVCADGFLYNMVRIMAGTLRDVAEGRIAPHDVDGIIAARDRSRAGATAPPCGLYLKNVTYPVDIVWSAK